MACTRAAVWTTTSTPHQPVCRRFQCHNCLLEQIGVCSRAHKHQQTRLCAVIELVRKQKVAANMALPMSGPSGPSLAISSSIASLSRFMSYRPDRDNRSQSFKKDFA